MTELQQLTEKIVAFRNERDWEQFHTSKDLAIALSVEASELLELFLWKGNEEVNIETLKDELADVMIYSLFLANKHNLNIHDIIENKIKKNAAKYPIEKARGNAKKYLDL